jgi:dipeptidyl aminopeptidase/acylaminoacyl peptidase
MAVTKRLLVVALALIAAGSFAQYKQAPASIKQVLNAPPTPGFSLSPAKDRYILTERKSYPTIEEVSRPYVGLAGSRLDPATSGPHMPGRNVGFTVHKISGGAPIRIRTPEGMALGGISWSLDGRFVAFTASDDGPSQLWLADTADGRSWRVPGLHLNAAHGSSFGWMPSGNGLWVKAVPEDRVLPQAPRVPAGPVTQDADGKLSPIRTFQDLLQNDHDADLYETLITSQLHWVVFTPNGAQFSIGKVGQPAMISSVDPSPDGKYFLIDLTKRPFSFLTTAGSFPSATQVWDMGGRMIHQVADLPSSEGVPIGGVLPGPRSVRWHPLEDATLLWTEALDGGDPNADVEHRDKVMRLSAPFNGSPTEVHRMAHRFSGMRWFEAGGITVVDEFDRDLQRSITWFLENGKPPSKVWDRSSDDRYGNPGSFVMDRDERGQSLILVHNGSAYLTGPGASPQGDRPFLDRFDIASRKATRMFHSAENAYEQADLLTDDGRTLLVQRETTMEPPNYYVQDSSGRRKITDFKDPAPVFRNVRKQLVTYKRADGVDLSFTLYLPPNYVEGTRLPTVVWAYPREFTDNRTAGQVSGSPHRFTTVNGTSPLFLVLEGYAVLMDATIPIVGDPETVNDTFIQQLVASAEAAINKAVEMGVTDRNRVGVMGHSYGAFMTAHLLAHSDLFKAGVARSGAYNRTLTPFGFQSERRTLWEAPETYWKISPFMAADKIKEPILFIHGTHDNNSGTFPMQSDRMFAAVKGNGGVARLVFLPFESHGYAAIESIEHTHRETIDWLDKYVKNAK